MTLTRRILMATVAFSCLAALSGCGLLLVGGTAATTAAVATDRRTTGEQVEDQSIELKASSEMRRLFDNRARVNAISYAGTVLLTGDVPTAQDRQAAEDTVRKIEKVRKVVNELRIGDITPISVRTNDTWITSKVKANLINTTDVPSRTINVTTERGIVYLMGMVTAPEGERAGKAAASVPGVNKVVKLFQFVSPESLQDRASPAPVENAPTSSPAPSSPAPTGSGVETMPVK